MSLSRILGKLSLALPKWTPALNRSRLMTFSPGNWEFGWVTLLNWGKRHTYKSNWHWKGSYSIYADIYVAKIITISAFVSSGKFTFWEGKIAKQRNELLKKKRKRKGNLTLVFVDVFPTKPIHVVSNMYSNIALGGHKKLQGSKLVIWFIEWNILHVKTSVLVVILSKQRVLLNIIETSGFLDQRFSWQANYQLNDFSRHFVHDFDLGY